MTITAKQPIGGASARRFILRTVSDSAGDVCPRVQNGINCDALAGVSSAGAACCSEPGSLCDLGLRLRFSEWLWGWVVGYGERGGGGWGRLAALGRGLG